MALCNNTFIILIDKHKNFKAIYTEEQLLTQIPLMIECWNRDNEAPNERSTWEAPYLVRERIGSKGKDVTIEAIFDIFNFLRVSLTKFGNKGLRVDNVYYNTDDNNVRELLMRGSRRYQVRVDLDTPEFVQVYQDDKPVLLDGEPVVLYQSTLLQEGFYDSTATDYQERAKHSQTQGDMVKRGRQSRERIEEIQKRENVVLDWRTTYKDTLNEIEGIQMAKILGFDEDELTETAELAKIS